MSNTLDKKQKEKIYSLYTSDNKEYERLLGNISATLYHTDYFWSIEETKELAHKLIKQVITG